jgi:hypothetical protein
MVHGEIDDEGFDNRQSAVDHRQLIGGFDGNTAN